MKFKNLHKYIRDTRDVNTLRLFSLIGQMYPEKGTVPISLGKYAFKTVVNNSLMIFKTNLQRQPSNTIFSTVFGPKYMYVLQNLLLRRI